MAPWPIIACFGLMQIARNDESLVVTAGNTQKFDNFSGGPFYSDKLGDPDKSMFGKLLKMIESP